MADNNGSCHSDTPAIDPVLSEAQMQMLQGMMAQARNEGRAKEQAEAANPNHAEDLPHRPEANLSRQPKQEPHYPDQRDLPQCRHDPDPNDPNDSDKPASDLLNMFCRHHNDDNNTCFQPEEVGFFNYQLDTKDYGSGDIIDAGGKIYFCNVHLFIDFFKNVARTKADGVIHRNLNKCL